MLNLLTQIPIHKLNHDYSLYTNHMNAFYIAMTIFLIIFVICLLIHMIVKHFNRYKLDTTAFIVGTISLVLALISTIGMVTDTTTPINYPAYNGSTLRKANVISNIRDDQYNQIPYYKKEIKNYKTKNNHMKKPYQHTYDNDIKDAQGTIKNMQKFDHNHIKDIKHPLFNVKF